MIAHLQFDTRNLTSMGHRWILISSYLIQTNGQTVLTCPRTLDIIPQCLSHPRHTVCMQWTGAAHHRIALRPTATAKAMNFHVVEEERRLRDLELEKSELVSFPCPHFLFHIRFFRFSVSTFCFWFISVWFVLYIQRSAWLLIRFDIQHIYAFT